MEGFVYLFATGIMGLSKAKTGKPGSGRELTPPICGTEEEKLPGSSTLWWI